MPGTLYLCATPIGNLKDITLRVLETLQSVDLIAAEDTRNSMKLLNHFDIHTALTSYHEHNKKEKGEALLRTLLEGKDVALITDAGTPAISDPGEDLVRKCAAANVPVTSLPGPSACITALTLSGCAARRFCFEGFLPGKNEKKERRQVLSELAKERRTIVLYEAPHRLKATVEELCETLGDRRLTICRELTKKFEEVRPTTLAEAAAYYETEAPRGEYVLVIEGAAGTGRTEENATWRLMSVSEHVHYYERLGLSRKEAMKRAASDRGVGKREVYKALESCKNGNFVV